MGLGATAAFSGYALAGTMLTDLAVSAGVGLAAGGLYYIAWTKEG